MEADRYRYVTGKRYSEFIGCFGDRREFRIVEPGMDLDEIIARRMLLPDLPRSVGCAAYRPSIERGAGRDQPRPGHPACKQVLTELQV